MLFLMHPRSIMLWTLRNKTRHLRSPVGQLGDAAELAVRLPRLFCTISAGTKNESILNADARTPVHRRCYRHSRRVVTLPLHGPRIVDVELPDRRLSSFCPRSAWDAATTHDKCHCVVGGLVDIRLPNRRTALLHCETRSHSPGHHHPSLAHGAHSPSRSSRCANSKSSTRSSSNSSTYLVPCNSVTLCARESNTSLPSSRS